MPPPVVLSVHLKLTTPTLGATSSTFVGKRANRDMIDLPHEVHDSISSCPHVCAALTQRPDESAVLGASMRRWQSETLSLIAGCMEQRGKYELISFLLDKMCFATCPPPGVSFTTSLLPVAHTLIYNYELWDDKDEVCAPDFSKTHTPLPRA